MHWLSKGLCLCGLVMLMTSCAQDKKLPQGVRISVLDSSFEQLETNISNAIRLPTPFINNSWPQGGINSWHVIGNIKANTSLKKVWSENFGKGITKHDIMLPAPVMQNNKIFVMDTRGKVSSFDFASGTLLWENKLTLKTKSFNDTKSRASGLAVDNDLLFATTGFGSVYAMDAATGTPKWRKVLESPIRIAPTVTPNMLLVQTVDNKLYALDKKSGSELWRFGVASEDTVITGGASPAYDANENIVVAGFSNGEIVVLNASIGTPLWSHMLVSNKQVSSTTEINTIGAYPIIEEGIIYAISNGNTMVALDIRSGDTLWEKEISSIQNMLLVGDYLFVISNRNILYAIEKFGGNIAWFLDMRDHILFEDKNINVYASQPIMINNNILLAFSNGKIFKINATNGSVVAKTDLDVNISNGIIAVEQRVVAVSDDADIIVFD